MSQIVWLINWASNQNRDYHYSLWLTSIIEAWVISGLSLSQVWSDVSITSWEAIVEVTRTSLTPNETFCVAFASTATESVTINANDYVYIEINPNRVDDPALNVESAGTWIWEIKAGATLPDRNYIVLWRADGSGIIQNTGRQTIRLKETMTATDKLNGGNWKILYTDWDWQVQELSFWTSWQVLWFTGTSSAPAPISPTVDILSLTEDTTWDLEDDEFVKNNWTWWNTKVKLSTYRATDAEVNTWTSTKKLTTPASIKNKYWIASYTITSLSSPSWSFSSAQYSSSIQMNVDAIINVFLLWLSWWTNPNSHWIQYSADNSSWTTLYSRITWSWGSTINEEIVVRVQKWYYIRVFQWWIWSASWDATVIARFQN